MTDKQSTEQFLRILDSNTQSFHFQTFDDSPDKRKAVVWQIFGTLNETGEALEGYNNMGAGCFVTINETDGKGRSAHNITRIRANFLDLDGEPLPEHWELEPHLIIESSPRRYHAYWIVKDEPLEAFREQQRAISRRYRGDPKVTDLPRVMRLPGYAHRKNGDFVTRIIHASQKTEPYPYEVIKSAYPVTKSPPQRERARVEGLIAEGARNDTLFRLACNMREKGWCEASIQAAVEAANENQLTTPLEPQEAETIWRSALRYAPGELPQSTTREQTVSKFELLTIRDIKKRRRIKYTVKGILEHGRYSQVFGEPGSGKTFWVLDLGLHVATGREYHGRKTLQGPVIYVCGEGSAGIGRRIRAWELQNRHETDDAPFFVSSMAVPLLDEHWAKRLYEHVDETCKAHGYEYPSMVIIDTVARNFGAGDENSTMDMQRFITHVDHWIAGQLHCTVLQVHHTGHQNKERSRGSSALFGALDVEYRVERGADGVMRVFNTKVKDMDSPPPLAFKVNQVELDWADEDEQGLTSLALKETRFTDDAGAEQAEELGGRHQEVYRLARDLYQEFEANLERQGLPISNARLEVRVLREEAQSAGIFEPANNPSTTRTRWARIIDTLVDKGLLKLEGKFIQPL